MTEKRRRRPRLALEITVALAVKFVALAVIWHLWFAHPAARRLDARGIGAAVYAAPAAGNEGGRAHAGP